ncbi:MAG TPA: Stp1/IreP family PP2C-type Ser/Thr phosphatase [Terracidiphilus sp.]|nr:Stp1/IreP family PP2C-type Ser/Thr phosphatase [Terracidiphilus sp.]
MQNGTALRLEVAALSDIGCKRTNNEDSFGYDLESRLFVVCDGMGGSAAGETASATAVKECVEYFCRQDIAGLTREDRLYRSILHANRAVYRMAQESEELRGMGTTLVSACVEDRRMIVGNVGDSRAYFLRGGVCAQITNDHSFVAEQVRMGSMNAEEAGSSPFQSFITRAIGAAEAVEPDIFTGTLEHGDILLLTSDGLTRYADAKSIAGLILSGGSLTGACQNLIDEAKRQGAVDNVTCLLVQFLDADGSAEPAASNGSPS